MDKTVEIPPKILPRISDKRYAVVEAKNITTLKDTVDTVPEYLFVCSVLYTFIYLCSQTVHYIIIVSSNLFVRTLISVLPDRE